MSRKSEREALAREEEDRALLRRGEVPGIGPRPQRPRPESAPETIRHYRRWLEAAPAALLDDLDQQFLVELGLVVRPREPSV